MNIHAERTQENKGQSLATTFPQTRRSSETAYQLVDNRPVADAQRKLQKLADTSPKIMQLRSNQDKANNSTQVNKATQLQSLADSSASRQHYPIQRKENNTGLPDNLKRGMESLSGIALDDVKVHRNSNKPAQLQAHAYAQGTNIHLAPGQEKHLSHEAWHVVQQKQGRVKPTLQMKGKLSVNDDEGLEREADIMGQKALSSSIQGQVASPNFSPVSRKPVLQRKVIGVAGKGYPKGKAQSYVDGLMTTIKGKVKKGDLILDMCQKENITVNISGMQSTSGPGGLDPNTMEITLFPKEKDIIVTENRERLFQGVESKPKYGEQGLGSLKDNTRIGRVGMATTLYHELGHFYQTKVQGIDVSGMRSGTAGIFLIELHNILQTENRLASLLGEPLRSTYRPTGGVKPGEIGEEAAGKESKEVKKTKTYVYKKKQRAIKEGKPKSDPLMGLVLTAQVKKIVEDYHNELKAWISQNNHLFRGKGATKKTKDLNTIITSSLDTIGSDMRESQIHLLQGIIDSAYYFIKDLSETKSERKED